MPADLRLLPRLGRVSLRAEFQALAFGRASTLPNRPGGWSKVAWVSAEPKNQQVVSLRDPCFLASFCQNSSVTNAPRRVLEWPSSVASGRDAHNDPCAICFPSPTRQFLQVSLGRRAGAAPAPSPPTLRLRVLHAAEGRFALSLEADSGSRSAVSTGTFGVQYERDAARFHSATRCASAVMYTLASGPAI
jgi:hypothetical protein